ncbi:MAG: response regulator [Bacteroidales bacterium]|nr:MAG: response regulator [Bacteroidales bacterium]
MEIALIEAKEKAEENDKLKTAFLHNISHEIRTPMNAIVGFSDLLVEPDLEHEKCKDYVDIITKSSNQLLSIINDIINISTIEAGQEKVHEGKVSINSMIIDIYNQFHLAANEKSIELYYKTFTSDDEATVVSDEAKLIEILSNLINNAIKFSNKGSIEFGYTIKDNEFEFFVKDSGIGIPESMHENIFKRFYQVETNSDRTYGGSGLGLSISKAYVEMLGGKIWVNSQVDSGSIFYFTIPYKKATVNKLYNTHYPTPEKKLTSEKKTILVAEDEDLNYNYMFELFSGTNFTIIRARNGFEAVELFKSIIQIDLVLMDIKMPIMNGYEATRKIKDINPKIPIIAQTAYAHESDKAKAFENGCDDYISKPFKKDMLISKINNLLI